jgi:hypothetical protein
MKLKLILAVAVLGAALALPSGASAAPSGPTLGDSVSQTGDPAEFENSDCNCGFFLDVWKLSATSGPSGENPTGEISWVGSGIVDHGPITCLAVSGNTAWFNYVSSFLPGTIVTVQVVDDSPDTLTWFGVIGRAATDCSPPPGGLIAQWVRGGDITVVDSQPPTTRGQCLNNGWKQLGFQNQGQCIAFVNHGP